jgi:hypothetical protein
MRDVSQRFLGTITGSHRMVARARLVTPGQTGTNPTGTEIPILDGDVQADASAEVRSSLELTTTLPFEDIPTTWPEVYVERGVVYGDGDREWVGLGYFRIQASDQENAPDGPIRISGLDRMQGIIQARLIQPRQYSASATIATVVGDLVWEVYPTVSVVIGSPFLDAATQALGTSKIVERDRFDFLLRIAKSYGCTMYFDHNGNFKMVAAPDPTVPVWTISRGRGGVLVRMSRSVNRAEAYNAWVAEGEQLGDTAPAHGVAYDLDPLSPTRYDGPFGPAPVFFSSSLIATDAQAVAAAEAMRNRSIGIPYNVTFGTVPNVALEVNDPVSMTYSDDENAETHVVDKLTYPLTPDAPMTGATRVAGWSS